MAVETLEENSYASEHADDQIVDQSCNAVEDGEEDERRKSENAVCVEGQEAASVESAEVESESNVQEQDEPQTSDIPLTFEQRVQNVRNCITAHPRRRELMYKILTWFDDEEHSEAEVEQKIESFPEFEDCLQNSHTILMMLVEAGAIAYFPINAEGEMLDESALEALTEDEYFDVVEDFHCRITDEGKEAARRMSPDKRLDELFESHPIQIDGYKDVLRFLTEKPHTRYEIEAFCKGKSYLKAPAGVPLPYMRPSHFIDKLERAGMIEWRDGKWTVSAAGRLVAAALQKAVG